MEGGAVDGDEGNKQKSAVRGQVADYVDMTCLSMRTRVFATTRWGPGFTTKWMYLVGASIADSGTSLSEGKGQQLQQLFRGGVTFASGRGQIANFNPLHFWKVRNLPTYMTIS